MCLKKEHDENTYLKSEMLSLRDASEKAQVNLCFSLSKRLICFIKEPR